MVFEKLKEIFGRVMPQCDPATITMDSVLATDLGVDSLNMMLLAITVEDEFKISSVFFKSYCVVCDRYMAWCKLELHSVGFSVRCSDHYRKAGYNRTDKSRKTGYLYKDSFYYKTYLCDRSRHAWMGTL